jgi:homoserine dehydrogenase
VVADLIDIARGEFGPPYAMPAAALSALPAAETGERMGRAYVRFTVADRVGVLAEIATAMRDAGVSIESLMQRGAMADGGVLVAIVTHEGPERAVAEALAMLKGSPSLTGEPLWMHILG